MLSPLRKFPSPARKIEDVDIIEYDSFKIDVDLGSKEAA